MTWIVQNLWLIPALPIAAAGIIALLKQRSRVPAASLAIGSMAASFLLALCAFSQALAHRGNDEVLTFNFRWFQFGTEWLKLGWMLDPLTAVMLVMVTFVGLLIFIYSTGYMEHDENFTRFFCFLALFAGAMLGVIIANSLVLLFMCWEIVGLTSYLLIGFWYSNPAAAAAAKKSVYHHPYRRSRVSPRHGVALCANRYAAVLRRWRRLHRVLFARSHGRANHGSRPYRLLGDRDPHLLRSGGASRDRSRYMYGCRTRWKVPRQSAH